MANEDFGTAGTTKGSAASWTLAEVSGGRDWAEVDGTDFETVEDFEEQWTDLKGGLVTNEESIFSYTDPDTQLEWALIAALTAEHFESGWSVPDLFDNDVDEQGKQYGMGKTAPEVNSTNAAPWALSNGQTLVYSVDGGATKTITLATADFVNIGAATVKEMVRVLKRDLVGATAIERSSTALVIRGTAFGASATLKVNAGDVATALGLATTTVQGTTHAVDWPDGHVAHLDDWSDLQSESASVENFEANWMLPGNRLDYLNHSFAAKYWDGVAEEWRFTGAQLEMASHVGAKDYEDFESGWKDNENNILAYSADSTVDQLESAGLGTDVTFGTFGLDWAAPSPPSYSRNQYSPRLWVEVVTSPAVQQVLEVTFTDGFARSSRKGRVTIAAGAAVGSVVYFDLTAVGGSEGKGVTEIDSVAEISGATDSVVTVKGDPANMEEFEGADWTINTL